MTQPFHVDITDGIATVTLDRPKANAIDAATSCALGEAFASFEMNPDVRVVIYTAAGERFFSAGWDLGAAADGEAFDSDYGVGGFGGFCELPHRTKPVIAAVNGPALGAGCVLASVCDIRIASDNCKFAVPAARLGLGYRAAGLKILMDLVGPSNAKTICDHLAVMRPEAWLMIGHCGGLRPSQRIGDYVLAHAYLRDDHVLDDVLPPEIPVPAIATVPLTRPWYTGVANVRGNLYSVVDLSAFAGGPAATASETSRLLLISDKYRIGCALLIDAVAGLRNPQLFVLAPEIAGDTPWITATYTDRDKNVWSELAIERLIQNAEFLDIAARPA